jgi:DUF2971 family protein
MAEPTNSPEIIQVQAPRYLYKYRAMGSNAGTVQRLLLHGEIWFASRSSFNDPFDCQPRVSLEASKQELRRYANHIFRDLRSAERKLMVNDVVRGRNARMQHDLSKVTQKLNEALDTKVGIFCLTARNDDILMWAHYAASHTGCCIQFDLTAGDPILRNALPVQYRKTYPVVRPIVQHGFRSFAPVFLTKSVHWNYEEEWRVVDLAQGQGTRILLPAAVTGVILGARISANDEAAIRGWAAERQAPLRISKARLGQYKYEVTCHDIEEIAEPPCA